MVGAVYIVRNADEMQKYQRELVINRLKQKYEIILTSIMQGIYSHIDTSNQQQYVCELTYNINDSLGEDNPTYEIVYLLNLLGYSVNCNHSKIVHAIQVHRIKQSNDTTMGSISITITW